MAKVIAIVVVIILCVLYAVGWSMLLWEVEKLGIENAKRKMRAMNEDSNKAYRRDAD